MLKFVAPAAALLLSGCASFAPEYVQPPPATPVAFPLAEGRGQAAADIGWRDFFRDPRLARHIEAALDRNQDLAASSARIAQARAQYGVTDSQRLPSLTTDASANRTRLGADAASAGGTGGAAADTVTTTQYNLGVSVTSFELDLWGRVRDQSESAWRQYLASVEGERAFRLSLISQVASTYLQLNAAREQAAFAQRTVAGRRQNVEIARLRLDAGVTSTIDYDQAVTLLTQAQTQLADIERTAGQLDNYLMVLTGGPVEGPLPAPLEISDRGQFAEIGAGAPSDLLVNRPDILQAEQTLRAANADIGAARAAFLPTISLTGQGGFVSSALDALVRSGASSASIGASLGLPLFDAGRRNQNLALARARRQEAIAQYQKATQTAFREVADALVARRRYAEQISAQTNAVDAQRRLAETAQLRYENGIAPYIQVLDASRSLFDAEQQLISLKSAALQNAVSLYVALGGGVRAEPSTANP